MYIVADFKMPIDLSLDAESAACRAVRLAAAAIGVDINLKYTDLKADEQLKPEFIKITYNKIFYKIMRLGTKF